MDFMTKGAEFDPVWYNDAVQWNVFLGGTIEGEVRIRYLGKTTPNNAAITKPKLEKLLEIANTYHCEINLYGNNCRMFAVRMEQEVERRNSNSHDISKMVKTYRIIGSGLETRPTGPGSGAFTDAVSAECPGALLCWAARSLVIPFDTSDVFISHRD